MKKILSILLCFIIIFSFSGCGKNKTTKVDLIKTTYTYEISGETNKTIPTLELKEDDSFTLVLDTMTETIVEGSYSVKKNILTLTSKDNKYIYNFKINTNQTLSYIEDGSTPCPLSIDRYANLIENNQNFIIMP